MASRGAFRTSTRARRAIPLITLTLLVGLVPTVPAWAVPTTYYVDDTTSPGDNSGCAQPFGNSIAAAVAAAASGDTIAICAGTYADQAINFSSTSKSLTFAGVGVGSTSIDGFSVSDGAGGEYRNPILWAGTGTITVRDLTLTDGVPAIVASGSVVVERVTFSANRNTAVKLDAATTPPYQQQRRGGAISVIGASGTVSITDSTFTSNAASQGGGAIFSLRPVTIAGSTFTSNTAVDGSGSGGGAVYGNSSVVVTDSSFTSNGAGNSGGAIGAASGTAVVTVSGSYFYGNTAGQYGGAIAAGGSSAKVDVTNSTFDYNLDSGGTCGCTGSAIYGRTVSVTHVTASFNRHNYLAGSATQNSRGGTLVALGALTVTNSIVVENEVNFGACAGGSLVSGGGNVVTASSCSALATPVSIASVALGAIADNGGPTRTRAITIGSAAVDAAPCLGTVAVDQRGLPRPYGPSANSCDAGAVEGQLWTRTTAQVSPGGQVRLNYPISDVATVVGYASNGSGGYRDPGGSVQFSSCFSASATPVWSTCSGSAVAIGSPVSLVGGANGEDGVSTATLSDWLPDTKGFYLLHATYIPSGAVAYLESTDDGVNRWVQIIDAIPSSAAAVADPSIAFGSGTTDTVTVTGSAPNRPTGSITFSYCSSPSVTPIWDACSGTATTLDAVVLSAAGAATATATSATFTPPSVGEYLIHAAYSGDARYTATSADASLTVTAGPTPVTYTGGSAYSTDPATVALAVSIGGPCAVGRAVTFGWDGDADGSYETTIGTAISNASGVASTTWSWTGAISTPSAPITALVASSSNCVAGSTTATVYFTPASSSASGSITSGSIAFGSSATATLTVTGADPNPPTGSVTFSYCSASGSTPTWEACAASAVTLRTIAVSADTSSTAIATSGSFVPPHVGKYLIHAAYAGDSRYTGSSADVELTVTAGPTSATYSGDTTYVTDPADVELEVTVGGACVAGRSVSFARDGDGDGSYETPLGTVTSDGTGLATTTWAGATGPTALVRASVAASDDCAAGSVTRTILLTRASSSTAGVLGAASIPYGSGTTSTVTVTGTSDAPTGTITFSSCYSAGSTPTWAACSAGATLLETVTLSPGAGAGTASAILASFRPTQLGQYLIHASYDGDSRYTGSSDGDVVTVTTAVTDVEYTGDLIYPVLPTELTLRAAVGGACPVGRSVGFFRDANGDGTYEANVGSGVSDSAGETTATWDLTGETASVFELEVRVAANTECLAGVTTTTVVIAGTGNASGGGGWYRPGARADFGYTIRKRVSILGTTITGQALWQVPGGIRLKGTVSAYLVFPSCSVAGATCGQVSGSASLWSWDGGSMSWVLVAPSVSFTMQVADGGTKTTCVRRACTTVSRPDYFGIDVAGRTLDGESGLLRLLGGSLFAR